MITVDVYSDIACPYCYIGKRHLEQAIVESGLDVAIKWRSFQLNPHAQLQYKEDRYTLLAQKYGQSREWALEISKKMTEQGQKVGIEFNFDINQPTNTFDAHRLLHLALEYELQNELKEAFFKAFFCQGLLLSDKDVLRKLSVANGLEPLIVERVLEGNEFAEDVRKDQAAAQRMGISSVPCFVYQQKSAILGAQPISAMKDWLGQIQNQLD